MDIVVDSLLNGSKNSKGIVVIIDVFRCFTTEAVAFSNGAEKIILVATIEEAIELKKLGFGDILMGEVSGKKPDGFDFGNSPSEIADLDFSGKTIIQSTRAGTVGVASATKADMIFGGSFAVASATAEIISSRSPNLVTLVAMGLEATIRSDEDELCALFIRNLLQGRKPNIQSVKNLVLSGEESQKYGNPETPHWPIEDLDFCLNVDSFDFALKIEKEEGLLVCRPKMLS
ncbi:MAG: 2-phosphosulfolactate phosphatase [SAR202 cluster bacterium]|nr:2-phosphosulfolactate phosphatase [Chloroflexota bacterium]MQG22889.1 2-phosphosulfolactate phosphatase [SAR202 cluster bacterium]|tara:strand:+ start:6928 stop:7620 length:693 start_codon:yes stop_codon:yes gene_type:complete